MIKKIIFFLLLFLFIYVSTFNIFMTEIFRIPAPIIFLTPLYFFYKYDDVHFEFINQLLLFFIAALLYLLIGEKDIANFASFLIKIACWAVFFNYIIANNKDRMMATILIYFGLLFISGLVMLLDHQFDIADIRSMLAAGMVVQSPSGISLTLFTFGYQMAALTTFIVCSTLIFKKNVLLTIVLIALAISFIFFGMQRSVLVAFAFSSMLFILCYFKFKSLLFLGVIACLLFLGQNYADQFSSDKNQQNILNKNVKQTDRNEERGDLMSENLKIIADYPFGLIFHNTSWNEVVKHNHVYKNGSVIITSHNAYLMFITYLGPVLGILLLIALHYKICLSMWNSFKQLKRPENAMLVCLSCSFIAISINSFFHNEWLLTGNGPTLILYFSILHLTNINLNNSQL